MKTVLFMIIAALLCACVFAHGHGHGGARPGGAGGHHGGPEGGRPHWDPQAYMNRFNTECSADQTRLCPDLPTPTNPMEINVFDSECFKANEALLSATCQEMLSRWRQWQAHHNQGEGNGPHHPVNPEHPVDPQQPETNPAQPEVTQPIVDLIPFETDKPNNNDDDDDDDDDGNKKPTHHHSSPQAAFYEACHQDKQELCPSLPDNVSPHDFFKAKCAHGAAWSPKCQHFFNEWRHARMAIFGVLISSTFATMFAGMLALMAVCCCVACCVRRRRVARRRRRSTKQLPTTTCQKSKSVAHDNEPLVVNTGIPEDVEQQQNYFPMQTFPAGAAFAPYSYAPQQYWQPVMFTPEQFALHQQQQQAAEAK